MPFGVLSYTDVPGTATGAMNVNTSFFTYNQYPYFTSDGTNLYVAINDGSHGDIGDRGGDILLQIRQSDMTTVGKKRFIGNTNGNGDYFYLTTYRYDPVHTQILATCIYSNYIAFENQNSVRQVPVPFTPTWSIPGKTNNALAWNASNSLFYTIDRFTVGGSTVLWTIDPATGNTVEIGNIGIANIAGLAFDGTTLYAMSGAGNAASSLYTINTSTAAPTLIGSTGLTNITSLARRPSDGQLFAYQSHNTSPAIAGGLYTVNKLTGAVAAVGATTGFKVPTLTFKSDSTLYGITSGTNNFTASNIVTFNTSTGAVTTVRETQEGGGDYGIAFDTAGQFWQKAGFNPAALYVLNPAATDRVSPPGDATGNDETGDWFDSRLIGTNLYSMRFDGNHTSWFSVLDTNSFTFSSATTTGTGTRNSEATGMALAVDEAANDGTNFYATGSATFGISKLANSNLNVIASNNTGIHEVYFTEVGSDGNIYVVDVIDLLLKQISPSSLSVTNSLSIGTHAVGIDAGDRLYYAVDNGSGVQVYQLLYSGFSPTLVTTLSAPGGNYTTADIIAYDSTTGYLFIGQNGHSNVVTTSNHPSDNSLTFNFGGAYSIDRDDTPGTSILVTVNTSSGVVNTVGDTTIANISALAFDGSTLYAVSGQGNTASSLYTLNISTGAATLVGSTGFSGITGIAIRPMDGVLFGYISGSATNALVTINKSTGAATAVGGGFSINIDDITFRSTNVLYGANSSSNVIGTIDTTTGSFSSLGINITNGNYGLGFNTGGTLWLKYGGPSGAGLVTVDLVNNKLNSLTDPRIAKLGPGAPSPPSLPGSTPPTPQAGRTGDAIVIYGSGFTGTTTVSFNGTSATFTVISDKVISAVVPNGATTGPITVANAGGSTNTIMEFFIIPALIGPAAFHY